MMPSQDQSKLPNFVRVKQRHPKQTSIDIGQHISRIIAELTGTGLTGTGLANPGSITSIPNQSLAGKSVAIGVGSRGISNFAEITRHTVQTLERLGAKPFIFPAMGSHGGGNSRGQLEILTSYGITEEQMDAPIDASMEVIDVGTSKSGIPVVCSKTALQADHILLINRIKPHTDFFGAIGSGLIKMSVVGLGKQIGATHFHRAAAELGYENALFEIAEKLFECVQLLGGIAVLENESHQTSHMEWIPRDKIFSREPELLKVAKSMMPQLPFDTIDLLIIDEIGKNISGAGIDPNITQRSIHGYNTLPIAPDERRPFIKRIFVRDLTPESHGNAVGIGMADATTQRLIDQTDWSKTYLNALTSMTPGSVKRPITFESDKQAILAMLHSLPLDDIGQAKIVRIKNTLELSPISLSESLFKLVDSEQLFESYESPTEIEFDSAGNLIGTLTP